MQKPESYAEEVYGYVLRNVSLYCWLGSPYCKPANARRSDTNREDTVRKNL